MKKNFTSTFTIVAILLGIVKPLVIDVYAWHDFRNLGITDEQLVTMIESGEIPINATYLLLGGNQISNLTPLEVLKDLEFLTLNTNQITDITPLSKLTNLQSLSLYNNLVVDVSPLENLTNLSGPFGTLDLGKNLITDISPLANLTKLEWLSLDNNLITDLSPLYKLENLTFYTLDGNPVSDDEVALLRLALQKADFVGRVLAGEPTIEDALEVLKYLAGMDNYLDHNAYAFYAACITGGDEPSIADVLEILKHLAGMKSVFGGGT